MSSKDTAGSELAQQIAAKELEYFKYRYKLGDRQSKELDDIITLFTAAHDAEIKQQAVQEFGEKLIGNMYQTFMRDYCPESCNGFGTYSERDSEGDPEPAQCQWCDEQRLPILNKLRTAIQEAMEDEK